MRHFTYEQYNKYNSLIGRLASWGIDWGSDDSIRFDELAERHGTDKALSMMEDLVKITERAYREFHWDES